MSYLYLNQPQIVSNIDKLVKYALSKKSSSEEVRRQLNDLYEPFMNIFDDDLFYSETIHAFIGSAESIVGDSYPNEVFWDQEKTQRFIRTLSFYKNDIEDETRAWRYNKGRNKINLDKFIRKFINDYSKLLFVFVDLKYIKEISHLITIDTFNEHINKFLYFLCNRDKCFKHLRGYAWALEQGGESGGLHCHLILIYNASKRQRDCYFGQKVGERWQDITGGLGTYYNWNTTANKRKFEDKGLLGIGMIHRDNLLEVENVVRVASYLTKIDKYEQRLKLWLPNMRTFGRGRFKVS